MTTNIGAIAVSLDYRHSTLAGPKSYCLESVIQALLGPSHVMPTETSVESLKACWTQGKDSGV